MPAAEHPLVGNSNWRFNQPSLGFQASYTIVNKKTGEIATDSIDDRNTCRETIISTIRTHLQAKLTNFREVSIRNKDLAWNAKKEMPVLTGDCDLLNPVEGGKPTQLKIQWHANWMRGWVNFPIEDFLRVCDVVLGPVMVLLGPNRPEGDEWWRTDPEKAVKMIGSQKYVCWQGSDNWFLAHPATVAIATGLYRQCFHLCGAGVANEILETVSEEEVAEVMSTNSQKMALLLIKRTRPWIEVPAPKSGNLVNYAFPVGFWRRLLRLQRAIRRHGYEKALGQDFHEGWTLCENRMLYGAYSFWGYEGAPEDGFVFTGHHRHLMEMGAPQRRQGGKSAKKTT